MDLGDVLALAAAGAGVGLMLLGGSRRAAALRRRDPLTEVRHERVKHAESPQGLIEALEVRLHDYGRSVEARIENRLTVLDQLILEADQEIARLEAILAEARIDSPVDRPLSRGEQQRCFAMHEAGFAVEETARCLNVTPAAVTEALAEWTRPDRRAA